MKRRERLPAADLLTGSTVLFASLVLVNGGNYLFNLILGRWLGPEAFADLSLIVTLMLMVTFVTVTFQLTAAHFAAVYSQTPDDTRLAAHGRWLGRQGWLLGCAGLLIMAGGAPIWQRFFHMQSGWPFVILGLGLPVYFAQGVGRGLLQGEARFSRLALSYHAEMVVRVLVGLGLVALGGAVGGAVLALSLSFVATWLVVRRPSKATVELSRSEQLAVLRYAGPIVVLQIGQILINNSDILLVKRFFPAALAGQYAAVALIGRVIFFATLPVVTIIFPLVAQRRASGESHRHLLALGLGAVAVVSTVISLFTLMAPNLTLRLLFGAAYVGAAPLLWPYSVATALFALANVVVTYRLSLNSGTGSLMTVAAGLVQVVALSLFHTNLAQVIWAQIGLMALLLGALLIWDGWLASGRSFRPILAPKARSTAP